MPELPEVETVARQLRPALVGATIQRVLVKDQKLSDLLAWELEGCTFVDVTRLGKQVVLSVSSGSQAAYVAVHLRMTGRLIWDDGTPLRTVQFQQAALQRPPIEKHLRAECVCSSGRLSFFDPRRFGTIQVTADYESLRPVGLDPTTEDFTERALVKLLENAKQPIKQWLLRQDRLVGLGNIYASEILFASRIHPERLGAALVTDEIKQLRLQTKRILARAIRHCGTTFSDFQDSTGSVGGFQRYLKVYNREGEPCPRCGALIERIVQQGRSTFLCRGCQQ
ncbi:MAG: bifunctional DNA-formamidopyrimidine glycosylase/DNA-(apurinic or apyrimidinic site) lyase [Bdellovibrionales bacterium]|nr:bifunctional DNA-formamidopyrimidine glycosylase/DNA-(apurinic or apyrimidinic site) lyase [Bdellovibrionales bacterium]